MNIEDLIKYTAVAESWQRLSKIYPVILSFESLEELAAWTKENPQLNLNPNLLWQGKEAADSYAEQRAQHEDYQMRRGGVVDSGEIPSVLSTLPAVAFAAFYKPKYLWDDSGYLKIVEKKKEAWLKEHKQKDLLSTQEGIDFVYGSLEENTPSKLLKESEEEFGKNPRYKKRVERYEKEKKKVYKKINDDPFIHRFKLDIQQEAAARYALLKKENPSIKEEDIKKQVEKRTWERFIQKNPDKTAEYIKRESREYNFLKTAHNNVQAKLQTAEPPVMPSPTLTPSPQPAPPSPQKEISRLDKLLGRPGHAPQKLYTPGNILKGNQAASASNLLNKARALGNLAKALPILANPVVLITLGVLLFIFIVVFMLVLLTGGGGDSSRDSGEAGGESIANCSFVRSDQSPPGAKYKSGVLTGYFEEASRLSGVPASILAGFARVESPGIVNYTDETLSGFPCARSSTGALGLMQLQPPPTVDPDARRDAYFGLGIDLGASFLNMRTEQLTRNDFCDIRKSIILASGFIIKKTGALIGTPTATVWSKAWDDPGTINASARGYYGCLLYPNCSSGPYNYGSDLWSSYSNCQTMAVSTAPVQNIERGVSGIIQNALGIIQKLVAKPEINSQGKTVYFYKAKPDEGISGEGKDLYWCTYLVIDTYNQAGFTGLTRAGHGSVISMKNYFQNTSANEGKYMFLPPSTPAEKLVPGDVVFFEGARGQHVSLIKSININSDGNGVVRTLDSNNIVTEDVIPVNNHRAINARTTASIYSITGFGRMVRQL